MADEGLPVQLATRVLGVSESGYYAALSRPPSPRSVRHALLTDAIGQVHVGSRDIYSNRRVHAELTLGQGLTFAHTAVEMLMQRAGIKGVAGRPRWRRGQIDTLAHDLVNRQFTRQGANQLWVTDITEHPTPCIPAREGKVYCCVVLDAYSRRVVGLVD